MGRGRAAHIEQDHAESGIADLDGLLEQIGCGGWDGPADGDGLMHLIHLYLAVWRLRLARYSVGRPQSRGR
jgi:hypothetical protein